LRQAGSREEKISILINALDFIRNQYFQWVLCSEFDVMVENLIAHGRTPGGAELSRMYHQLLREYYGREITIPEEFGREWMVNSVPFLSYEHRFWPAGVAAGTTIAERLRKGESGLRKAIDQSLGYGESDRTYGLLLSNGIDLAGPDAYRSVFARMNRLMDELEENLL
jgi:oligoendopeptidase F